MDKESATKLKMENDYKNLIDQITREIKNLNDDFTNWFRYIAKKSKIFNSNVKKYNYAKTILGGDHNRLQFKINYYQLITYKVFKNRKEIYYNNQRIGYLDSYIDDNKRFRYDLQIGNIGWRSGLVINQVFESITDYILFAIS